MSFVLGGDIGGTRARFSLVELGKGKTRKVVHHDVLESRTFRTFEDALAKFVASAPKKRVVAASFGIAGPIVGQRVKATNLPWTIDAKKIAGRLGGARVTLLNDLVTQGLGALDVPPSKLKSIQAGLPKKQGANVAVIAAGTGLGEASFIWDGTRHVACATEGGHTDFAPQDEVERALHDRVARDHGHVSWEDVASGSSISVLYDFCVKERRLRESARGRAFFLEALDKNVAVVELAEKYGSVPAKTAIRWWASLYGAEAGNLALKSLAIGGVYLCGGVSARLVDVLGAKAGKGSERSFRERFVDKGKMRGLLEKVPIAVVLEPRAGLLGAVAHAASQA